MVSYLPFKTSLISSFRDVGYADIGDLHLNVFRPENAENCPVMVWIHGGGFYIDAVFRKTETYVEESGQKSKNYWAF